MSKIPNNIHVIYGLAENFGWDEYEHFVAEVGKTMKRPKADPFNIIRYLNVKSAYDVNKPDNIFYYYKHEPEGEWWDRALKYITPIKIEPPTEIFGNPVNHFAHQTDVIRLQVLIEEGGIYLDSDVLCNKSFGPLLDIEGDKGDFIMSKEGDGLHKLSNAIMLSKKGAEFPQTWLGRYTNFNDDVWVEHSIELPYTLSEEFPDKLTILGHKAFAWPLYHSEHLRWFFRNGVNYAKCDYSDGIVSKLGGNLTTDETFDESYALHLWTGKSVTNEFVKDFPDNPMEDWLTVENIRNIDTPFNKLARRFLEDI
jgi:hypothetical protein